MKEEKVVFRVGDKAKIIIPKVVKRVGYPKGVKDYEPQVLDQFGPQLEQIFTRRPSGSAVATRNKVVEELAYWLAKRDKFGGNQRSVHLEEKPDFAGQTFFIHRMKTYFEGTYVPGHGYGGYEHEGYEPPTLSVSRAVRCAIGYVQQERGLWHGDEMFRIPVSHLEKLS